MFQKRKKFKEEITPEKRLSDRWEQQVFFITRKFPHLENEISAIVKTHSLKKPAANAQSFIPSEEALVELANLSNRQ